MTATIDDMTAALRGTALEHHPVDEGLGDTLIIENVDPGRLLEVWRAARAVVPVTGRWPVFTSPGGLYAEPSDDDVATLATAARTLDPWTVYRHDPGDTRLTEARTRFEQIVADPAEMSVMQEEYGSLASTRFWHAASAAQLVLLPTDKQWLAPAWLTYFGAGYTDGYEAWAAAMIEWERRWGAELVAAWGTMLQFVVARRPEPGEEAWQLAGQLIAVGRDLQMEPWQLAVAVTVGDAWFLHSRP